MSQQVNLQAAKSRVSKKALAIPKMKTPVIVIAILVASAVGLAYWKLNELKSSLTAEQQAITSQKKAIQNIEKSAKQTLAVSESRLKIVSLIQDIKKKQVLKKMISSKTENTANLSDRFLALSRQDIQGLWLNDISFDEGGSVVTLSGKTSDSTLLSNYLNQLSAEPSFEGASFSSLKIENEKNDQENHASNLLSFMVSSKQLDSSSTTHVHTVQK